MKTHPSCSDWAELLTGLREELAGLDRDELAWLRAHIGRIEQLQRRMHQLALPADAEMVCADCRGACCERGLHHLNLVNLLSCLLRDEPPPMPDFSAACPMLAEQGCLLPVERRPFNCVTFFCDAVESRLPPDSREAFYSLEKELRRAYEKVAERYPAATLRGVWIYLARHRGERLLQQFQGPP